MLHTSHEPIPDLLPFSNLTHLTPASGGGEDASVPLILDHFAVTSPVQDQEATVLR